MIGNVKPLKTLYLHLTVRCNLRCRYCYISGSYSELPAGDWLKLLSEAAKSPPAKIVFTGGEPLLYTGIFDIARFCKEHMPDVFLCLMTNGTMVSEENARCCSVFDEVRLSVDGDESFTDSMRGDGCTRHVKHELNRLLNENVTVTASVTTLPESPPVEKIVQDVIGLGFTNINIHPVKRLGKAKSYPPQYSEPKRERQSKSCGAGLHLNIMPNGRAYPCHALIRPEFLLGAIPADSYSRIRATLAKWEKKRFPKLFTGGACIGDTDMSEDGIK